MTTKDNFFLQKLKVSNRIDFLGPQIKKFEKTRQTKIPLPINFKLKIRGYRI